MCDMALQLTLRPEPAFRRASPRKFANTIHLPFRYNQTRQLHGGRRDVRRYEGLGRQGGYTSQLLCGHGQGLFSLPSTIPIYLTSIMGDIDSLVEPSDRWWPFVGLASAPSPSWHSCWNPAGYGGYGGHEFEKI